MYENWTDQEKAQEKEHINKTIRQHEEMILHCSERIRETKKQMEEHQRQIGRLEADAKDLGICMTGYCPNKPEEDEIYCYGCLNHQ